MAMYLVTGGCGYLGSRLVGHLMSQGHYVRILDNLSRGVSLSKVDCVDLNIGDVCDFKTVEKFMEDVDGCFHLADLSELDLLNHSRRDIKITLTGGFNVFSAAEKSKTKVVYVSSSAIYGDNAALPLCENCEPCPLTPYAADKRALELHAKVASLSEGVPTIGLRLFNLYGERYPHEYIGRDVISEFVQCVLEDRPITIFGHGQQSRDFIHVNDVIPFLTAAMDYQTDIPEVFNICSGRGISISELAQQIMMLANKRVPLRYEPSRAGDIYGSIGCPKKSHTRLECAAQTSLNEGLYQLIKFSSKTPSIEKSAFEDIPFYATELNGIQHLPWC